MSGWPPRRIEDVVVFLNAKRVPVKAADRAVRQGPYPYYGASGIVDSVDGFILDGKYLLVSEDGENLRSRNTPIAFIAKGRFWVNNHAHILDEKEPGILDYLSRALNMTDLAPYITGAAQPKLNKGALSRIEVRIPNVSTRMEINAILGALDDKIEVNRKASTTLEAMARAIYRAWFVDFDPVWARCEGRQPAHMDAATAALFPDSFDDDGLPLGWRDGVLADLIEFNPKERLPKGTLAPYFDMKALPTSGMTADAPILRDFASGTKFRAMDTLLARITPCLENGKTAMIDNLGAHEVAWGSTEFIVMRAKDGAPASLPYCVARDRAFRGGAISTMTGSSGRQRADAERISSLPAAIPEVRVLKAFGDATMSMISRIHEYGRESRTLATLRDTLLPRLMSGELRVGAARELMEELA